MGSLTDNTAKPLLEVGGKPFILYLIDYLVNQGVTKIILSTGYKAESFKQLLTLKKKNVEICFSEEKNPLGTGGGVRLALPQVKGERILVLNGDTYFPVELEKLEKIHFANRALATIALKLLKNCDRYGTVQCKDNRITGFTEKKPCKVGLINGGIYLLEKSALLPYKENASFSFEKEFLEKHATDSTLSCCEFSHYFLDLGVPADFEKAQSDCTNW